VYGPYPSWTTLANARRPRENKPDLERHLRNEFRGGTKSMKRAAIRFATLMLVPALILLVSGVSSADTFNIMKVTVVKGSVFKAVDHDGFPGQWTFVLTTNTPKKIASVDIQLYQGARATSSDQVCGPATIMGQTFAKVLSFSVKGNQLRDGSETVTTTVGDSVSCVRLVLTGSTGATVSAEISHA